MKINMKNVLSKDAKKLFVFLCKTLNVDVDLDDYKEDEEGMSFEGCAGKVTYRTIYFEFCADWVTYHTIYERWDYMNEQLEKDGWKLCIIWVTERKRNTDYEVKLTFKRLGESYD